MRSIASLPYTLFLKISSGGLFNTPRLFSRPITIVNIDIVKNNQSAGNKLIANGISKLYFASSQVPITAITIPVNADKAPKKS